MDKIFWNKASAKHLGWSPRLFGLLEFDEKLIEAIKKFQKQHDIKVDGLCGETTFRRAYTDYIARQELICDKLRAIESDKSIYCNGKRVKISWDKVVTLDSDNSMVLKDGFYGSATSSPKRDSGKLIVHHDATLSSAHCYKILDKRDLSAHFSIDNDGTIYQFLDTNLVAQHAGKKVNSSSIGVEISNACYTKYQGWYKRHGFLPRPEISEIINGKTCGPYTGLYPVQIEAFKALAKTLCNHYSIPLTCPQEKKYCPEACKKEYRGVLQHYHIDRRKQKWDCFGLDLEKILKEIGE